MSDLTPKPVRSACPPGASQLPGGAKLGLGEDAKVGVEVSPKKMLWLSGRHGRVFLKEDGTAGFKTKAIKIKSLAKVAVGASAKQGKIKAAAPAGLAPAQPSHCATLQRQTEVQLVGLGVGDSH